MRYSAIDIGRDVPRFSGVLLSCILCHKPMRESHPIVYITIDECLGIAHAMCVYDLRRGYCVLRRKRRSLTFREKCKALWDLLVDIFTG